MERVEFEGSARNYRYNLLSRIKGNGAGDVAGWGRALAGELARVNKMAPRRHERRGAADRMRPHETHGRYPTTPARGTN